jgi:hypothetical protein
VRDIVRKLEFEGGSREKNIALRKTPLTKKSLCVFGSALNIIDYDRIDSDRIDSDRIDSERIDLCLDTIM